MKIMSIFLGCALSYPYIYNAFICVFVFVLFFFVTGVSLSSQNDSNSDLGGKWNTVKLALHDAKLCYNPVSLYFTLNWPIFSFHPKQIHYDVGSFLEEKKTLVAGSDLSLPSVEVVLASLIPADNPSTDCNIFTATS